MADYFDASTDEDYYAALQRRIDDGSIWHLEGSAGRAAMEAIHAGHCTLGPTGHRDYWGNYVPGRDEVKPGTPGSSDYMQETDNAES